MRLTEFFDIVRTIAVVAGAGAAFWGVSTWRRQLKGTGRYEIGALDMSYHFSDGFFQERDSRFERAMDTQGPKLGKDDVEK